MVLRKRFSLSLSIRAYSNPTIAAGVNRDHGRSPKVMEPSDLDAALGRSKDIYSLG
jgi:hypothetical protein